MGFPPQFRYRTHAFAIVAVALPFSLSSLSSLTHSLLHSLSSLSSPLSSLSHSLSSCASRALVFILRTLHSSPSLVGTFSKIPLSQPQSTPIAVRDLTLVSVLSFARTAHGQHHQRSFLLSFLLEITLTNIYLNLNGFFM